MKLDKFEQEIEDNIDEYQPISSEEKQQISSIIKKAKEKKSVSLRLHAQDLTLIKQKAEREGIPYQTLISSILHKYINDQLVDQNAILKSIQMLKYGR